MTSLARARKSGSSTEEMLEARRGVRSSRPHLGPSNSPHSAAHLVELQRLAGNQAVAALVGGLTIQRLVDKDTLWDAYGDAYWARMNARNRAIDPLWTKRFFKLEEQLYEAKALEATQGPNVYNAAKVQGAHDKLHELGFDAPAPAEDPNEKASREVLRHAKQRWSAFRRNAQLNRGAWAGSTSNGPQPNDYVQTSAAVIAVLRQRQVSGRGRIGAWWLMASDSAPSSNALHRGACDDRGDFIYHL